MFRLNHDSFSGRVEYVLNFYWTIFFFHKYFKIVWERITFHMFFSEEFCWKVSQSLKVEGSGGKMEITFPLLSTIWVLV